MQNIAQKNAISNKTSKKFKKNKPTLFEIDFSDDFDDDDFSDSAEASLAPAEFLLEIEEFVLSAEVSVVPE